MKFLTIVACLTLLSFGAVFAEEAGEVAAQTERAAPTSELDALKAEWEAVREQQIRMIREKEDQLEKLKEEIFARMKASGVSVTSPSQAVLPVVAGAPAPILPLGHSEVAGAKTPSEFEAQKAAFQAERQKFFEEINRQKEILLQFRASLDEKAKQLQIERERFEREKEKAVS